MSGFVLADAAALRAVNVNSDSEPKIRWLTSVRLWYELRPEVGGESDDGDLIISPTIQKTSGNVHWRKGTIGIVITSGPSSPVGSLTPGAANLPYKQLTSDRAVSWLSTGVTSVDWRAIGGTAIQQTYPPNEAPAFAGQIWQEVSIDSAGAVSVVSTWKGVDIGGAADTSSWSQE